MACCSDPAAAGKAQTQTVGVQKGHGMLSPSAEGSKGCIEMERGGGCGWQVGVVWAVSRMWWWEVRNSSMGSAVKESANVVVTAPFYPLQSPLRG